MTQGGKHHNHKTDKKVTCQAARQKLGRTISQSKMESSVNKVTCRSAQHKWERCKGEVLWRKVHKDWPCGEDLSIRQ